MHSHGPLDCEWEINTAGHHVCRLCGYIYTRTPKGPLRRNCPVKMPLAEPMQEPSSLGDHLAMMLDASGITPKRVTWFLRAVNLIEADATCGCDERKHRLNKIGERLAAWFRRHA